jgi:L-ascorbate metabolism protein UlaG (beta-lactamase superfamily)
MTITYLGHSAIQIESERATLLIDPFISGNKHIEGKVEADALRPDVLLLTHAHGDHWGDTPAIVGNASPLVISNYEIVTYLGSQHGHEKSHGMNTGGSYGFDWGTVTQTFARHSSSFPDGTYGGSPNGFILQIDGMTIYDAGDTDRFAEMAWYGEQYEIDLLFLPIGDNFTMGIDEAVRAAKMLKPRLTVPIHYDTFPPIEVDAQEFARKMAEAGLEARVMAGGETLEM